MLRDVVAVLVMLLLSADIVRMLLAGPSRPQGDPAHQPASEFETYEL